jgi:TP901 family phage tail tape measure protein
VTDRTTYLRVKGDITDLQGKLRKGRNDIKSFADTTSKSIQKNRSEWSAVSTQIGLMGTSLLGLSALAAKSFASFDKSLSTIRAQGGEAAARIDELREAAIRAGADTQYSAAEAADAITDLAKAGLSVSDILGGGLAGSLSLAAAGEMDVKAAAEDMSTALMQFGLDGSDASHVADLLAAGANKAMGEVSDLAMALGQGGLVAHQTGLTIDETTAALSAFAQQGLLGSDAGTSLKTMLQRLTPQSAEAQKMMTALGLSAYDSSGNFVGLADYAGQLHDKLGKLSPAARNSALSVMFGSDAVRAAGVLYSEGSEGIQKWIANVSDAGFAARQAAVLTDNLSGDLERLSGSLDTVAIQSGSGLNDALRGMTQNATGLVNVIGELPAPVLTGAASLTALGGVLMIGTSLVAKGAVAWSDYRTGMEALGQEHPKVASGIDKVGKAARRTAIALAALQVVSIIGSSIQDGIDKASGSLGDMGAAAADAGEHGLAKLDTEFGKVQGRFFLWEAGTSQAKGFGDAIKQVADASSGWGNFTSGLQQTIAGLAGSKTAITELKDQTNKLDQSLAAMDSTQAQTAFAKIREGAEAQGVSMDDLIKLFPEYKASLQSTAVQLGETGLTTKEYADWMSGKVPTAVKLAAAAHPELVDKLADTQQAAIGATASISDYAKALWESANQALALSGSTIGYKAMLDDTAAATRKLVKETKNKKDLTDLDTKAGREAQTTLDKIASTTIAHTQKLLEQRKGQKAVNTAMEDGRKAFADQARQMGFTETAISSMIAEYGLVPVSVNTDMSVTGAGLASTQLDSLKASIKGLPKSAQTRVLSAFDSDGIDGAYEALDKIDGDTAEAWIESLLNRGGIQDWEKAKLADKYPKIYPKLMQDEWVLHFNTKRQGGPKLAGGGAVWGAGTATSDSIDAKLSNGEHVLTAADVLQMGGQAEVYRFRRGLHAGVYRFADGGAVEHYAGGGAAKKRKAQAKADAEARASLLAELQTWVRRGTIPSDVASGSGLSQVDTMLDWADNSALSKAARAKLKSAALSYEKTLGSLTSQLNEAKSTLDTVQGIYDDVYSNLSRAGSSLADLAQSTLTSTDVMRSDANGNIWYETETTGADATAGSITARKSAEAAKLGTLATKLGQLQRLGANTAFLQEIASVAGSDVNEAISIADMYLQDNSQIGLMNSAYDQLTAYSKGAAEFVTDSAYQGGLAAAKGVVDTLGGSLASLGEQLAGSLASALGKVVVGTSVTTKAKPKKKAVGGPVYAGELYQVNEQGIELFRPAVSGVILTASQTQQAIGSGGFSAADLAAAFSRLSLTLLVDGKPVSAIVQASLAAEAGAVRYALPGGGI